jgi:putative GTP pyrophosphokinase
MEWETFFLPYEQAVSELKAKLRGIRHLYALNEQDSPIEFVTGRIKPQASIEEKLVRRHVDLERIEMDLQDIAGLRVMVKYVEDIYRVVEMLRQRTDLTVLEERDYVTNAKPSGYRSYHIVIEYPVQLPTGVKKVLAEIQVRTLSMNFWATVEHDLKYKHESELPEELQERLTHLAEMTFALDQEMSEIHLASQKRKHT